jgi:hypothetical protein
VVKALMALEKAAMLDAVADVKARSAARAA